MRPSFLFRLNDKRQLTQWRCWAEADEDGEGVLVTEYGRVDGALQTRRRDVRKPGRHDSTLDKAAYDAAKKMADKIAKEGYSETRQEAERSSEEKPRGKVRKREEDEDDGEAIDLSTAPLPMLARSVKFRGREGERVLGMEFPLLGQAKIDGFRCVCRLSRAGGAELYSRTRRPYLGFPSLKRALSGLAAAPLIQNQHLYLDGELYLDTDGDFSKLSSQLKRGQNRPGYEVEGIHFIVFDCYDPDRPEATFAERHRLLSEHITEDQEHYRLLGVTPLADVDEARATMRRFLDEGHEGIMLRAPDGPYEPRKRSAHLQKLKLMEDAEFKIVGWKEGNGGDTGTVVWHCETADRQERFWVRPQGTVEHRAWLFENAAAHVGKQLTVVYQELSASGCPRFPTGKAIRHAE